MNTRVRIVKQIIATAVASLFIVACVTAPPKHDDLDAVRSKLTQLQSDPQLATRAPQAIKEAELAVGAAGEPRKDAVLTAHLVLIADRKVDIARAQAQSALLVDQRKALSAERETARLDARTHEADIARIDATAARADADSARVDADAARVDTDVARTEADMARGQAEFERLKTDAAMQQAAELQRQIADLNAKATDRGLVVTLGDVLFETGRFRSQGERGGQSQQTRGLSQQVSRPHRDHRGQRGQRRRRGLQPRPVATSRRFGEVLSGEPRCSVNSSRRIRQR